MARFSGKSEADVARPAAIGKNRAAAALAGNRVRGLAARLCDRRNRS